MEYTHSYGLALVSLVVGARFQHLHRHPSYLLCVGTTVLVKASGYTVGVSYRFHLKNQNSIRQTWKGYFKLQYFSINICLSIILEATLPVYVYCCTDLKKQTENYD